MPHIACILVSLLKKNSALSIKTTVLQCVLSAVLLHMLHRPVHHAAVNAVFWTLRKAHAKYVTVLTHWKKCFYETQSFFFFYVFHFMIARFKSKVFVNSGFGSKLPLSNKQKATASCLFTVQWHMMQMQWHDTEHQGKWLPLLVKQWHRILHRVPSMMVWCDISVFIMKKTFESTDMYILKQKSL